MTSVSVLPEETLINILELASAATVTVVMRTNSAMHSVGARVLYTNVEVSGTSARMFFSTMASRTILSNFYATFVRGLSFSVSVYSDKFLVFPVFCETLACLQGLRHLSIVLSPGDGEFMCLCMKRFGIVREYVSTLAVARLEGEKALSTRLTLPILHTFRLGGDIALSDVILHRRITDLVISTPLNYDEIEKLLDTLASVYRMHSLESLSIRLKCDVAIEPVLHAISESLPGLRSLTVEQPSVDPVVSQISSSIKRHCLT